MIWIFLFVLFFSENFGEPVFDPFGWLPFRCFIPKKISHTTRALLLQQCFSRNQGMGNETKCYKELGCFSMDEPWVSIVRPFPTPLTPPEIDVSIYLYTREHEPARIKLWPNIKLKKTGYDHRRPTVFVIHGFASNGEEEWIKKLVEGYLKLVNANIFIIDWRKGATLLNYLQVASNTRIVGAEGARFLKYLIEKGQNPALIHLIGHSLGAHISAYMSKGLKSLKYSNIGRITGLDPAQPGFELVSDQVRLDKSDADLVDVIHTNARPFIPFFGFGLMAPIGHVDFYLNGGAIQPGCIMRSVPKMSSIFNLESFSVESIRNLVQCSHARAYEVFISSIFHFGNCTFWGRKMPIIEQFLKITSIGTLSLADPLIASISKCTNVSCTVLGLETFIFPATGAFAVITDSRDPYCTLNSEDSKLKNILTNGIYKTTIERLSNLTNRVQQQFYSTIDNVSKSISNSFFNIWPLTWRKRTN